MSEKLGITVYFMGEKSVYIDGDSTILHRLKTEEWVQVESNHIKTANITHIYVSDMGERESATSKEDLQELVNWL